MEGLKVCVIGAGSTYTPELIEGFIKRKKEMPIAHISLMDIDEHKLEIVGNLAIRMAERSSLGAEIELTTDRKKAIEGAAFILTQIRVGGIPARIKDEHIPLEFGILGQETTGPGGFAKALRTIPVMLDIARDIEKLAPGAWLINFTNPSGIITEALLKHSKVNVIGLCNVPIGMIKSFAAKFECQPEDLHLTYIGLNHLSWVTRVTIRGRDVTKEAVEKAAAGRAPEDQEWMRQYCMIPNGYLHYYYARDKVVEEQRKAGKTRGEIVAEVESNLLKTYQNPKLSRKPKLLEKRGGAHYSTAAVSLASAIYNNKKELHIVNVRNQGTIQCLPYDCAIEANCVVDGTGAHPLSIGEVPLEIRGLLQAVKCYEELTVIAGVEGSYTAALQALVAHPLVPSFAVARELLERILEANKEYLPQFKAMRKRAKP
ncbi:MAG: 6-phospho-beta-glucosidase [Armatimonadota bacterium]|nr:6-phospho-beta-glucosidase [Armatimonadota bacterium]